MKLNYKVIRKTLSGKGHLAKDLTKMRVHAMQIPERRASQVEQLGRSEALREM